MEPPAAGNLEPLPRSGSPSRTHAPKSQAELPRAPEGPRPHGATLWLQRSPEGWRADGEPSVLLGRPSGEGDDRQGCWAEWRWNGRDLHFRNDRFGFQPVYRYGSGDCLGVSTSIPELLARGASPELDDDALAVFLRLGCFLGEDTPFRRIRQVPPGCRVAGPPDALRWPAPLRALPEKSDVSRTEARRRYGDLLEDAIERLPLEPEDRVALPLSGGRDSRHILLAMVRRGRLPEACVSVRYHPPKPNEDAEIAARLAAAVGVPHRVLAPPSRPLEAEREKNAQASFCAREHAWILPLVRQVPEEGWTVLVDGIGGDVLSGLFLTEERVALYEGGQLRELAGRLLGPEGYLPHLLPPPLYRRWSRERALRRLETELARHRGAPNPIGQFYFWNRTRRQIALSPWALLARGCDVVAPFLDHRVYDFLASLPAELLLDRELHSETIRERYPRFAGIPFETGGCRAPVSRGRVGALALSAAGTFISPRTDASFVRRAFLAPRLARAVIDLDYGGRLRSLLVTPLYLTQLAALVDAAGRAD